MTNCIFYTLFFYLFVSLSFGSLRFSQVHRTFLSIYKGMLEACVLTVDDGGEPTIPYYDIHLVEQNVRSFLDTNISKYVNEYTLSFSFLDEKKEEICSSYCRFLGINLKADINFFYKYDKTLEFQILSKDQL